MTTETADPIEQVTQRTVPAAGAPMPPHAASSVFALAGGQQADPPAETPQEPTEADWMDRARKTFDACRELSCTQLQEALGSSRSRATSIVKQLLEARQIVQLRKDGVVPIYGAPAGGFKGWLERQAQPPAAAPAKAKRTYTRRAKAPAAEPKVTAYRSAQRALASVLPPAAGPALPAEVFPMQAPRAELDLGFFTSGEIEIKADGQAIRLDAQRARKLIDWALRVDALLSPGGI